MPEFFFTDVTKLATFEIFSVEYSAHTLAFETVVDTSNGVQQTGFLFNI